MLEGPKEVTGVAKVTFDAWATKYYTRPRDGALAVTDDPNELKRLLESALASAHVHAQPQIPHGRPPTQREEYKITINFSNGRYLGKTLEQVGRMDHEGAAFLRWLAGWLRQPAVLVAQHGGLRPTRSVLRAPHQARRGLRDQGRRQLVDRKMEGRQPASERGTIPRAFFRRRRRGHATTT